MARPSLYKPEYAEQAAKLCRLGATDIELADFFNVDVRTIYRWKNQFPAFCQAIKIAAEEADNRVERSLYERATGYSYPSVKIFQYEGKPVEVPYREHVPPDTTAMIFWLKCRKPAQWRDRTEFVVSRGAELTSDEELEQIVRAGSSQRTPAATAHEKKPH